jgi:hypothetical protein
VPRQGEQPTLHRAIPRRISLTRALAPLLLLACALTGCGERAEATALLRLQGTDVRVYRQGNTYTYRRNNWFFYACGDAERRTPPRSATGQPRRILVHIDSHSDAHAAPTAAAPESLRAESLDALEIYTARLSIGSYMFPMLRYGFADEIYWVQPEISCFQGPEEIVRFGLEERNGWIRPALRADATPARVESLTVRAFRGEPVARSQELSGAYGYETGAWEPGPYTLHCLSLEQFAEHVREGRFAGAEVLVDLDLDYFGSGGPLHGYGYLGLPRRGQIAVGLLGGTLPVFYMTAEGREREVRSVCELIKRLAPRVIGISESPEHSHLEDLPRLAAGVRACLRGARPDSIPGAQVRLGVALSAACAQFVDLGPSRTPRVQIDWARPPADSLDITLYFDPAGSRDRRMAGWRVPGDQGRVTLPLRIPDAGIGSLLGPGWDLEIRQARDGELLFGAEFILDAEGELLRRALVAVASADPARYLSLSPREIIAEGRALGLAPATTNRILIALPRTLESQCRNLSAYRRAGGTIGGSAR